MEAQLTQRSDLREAQLLDLLSVEKEEKRTHATGRRRSETKLAALACWRAIVLSSKNLPELVEAAAERIQSYIVRQHLEAHNSAIEAYQKGGMVTTDIHAILAEDFCQDLLAPVLQQYEDEKARIETGV